METLRVLRVLRVLRNPPQYTSHPTQPQQPATTYPNPISQNPVSICQKTKPSARPPPTPHHHGRRGQTFVACTKIPTNSSILAGDCSTAPLSNTPTSPHPSAQSYTPIPHPSPPHPNRDKRMETTNLAPPSRLPRSRPRRNSLSTSNTDSPLARCARRRRGGRRFARSRGGRGRGPFGGRRGRRSGRCRGRSGCRLCRLWGWSGGLVGVGSGRGVVDVVG